MNTALSGWQNFYEIVGSSGAALIGIQFVVIALIAGRRTHADFDSINAFGTPTVVHFGCALAVSAIMSAPWPSLFALSVALAAFGLGGLVYAAIVCRRARRQTAYEPVTEDWVWYVILPCGLYVAIALAGLLLRTSGPVAPFVIGGATLGLLFTGIHNAWDSVTHVIVVEVAAGDATKPK